MRHVFFYMISWRKFVFGILTDFGVPSVSELFSVNLLAL